MANSTLGRIYVQDGETDHLATYLPHYNFFISIIPLLTKVYKAKVELLELNIQNCKPDNWEHFDSKPEELSKSVPSSNNSGSSFS